jgi:hypothetical protein
VSMLLKRFCASWEGLWAPACAVLPCDALVGAPDCDWNSIKTMNIDGSIFDDPDPVTPLLDVLWLVASSALATEFDVLLVVADAAAEADAAAVLLALAAEFA